MMEEITRLSAALAERMRELRADPTDPRLAPLFAQYQALLRQHMATVRPAIATSVPATEYAFDLPAELEGLLREYLKTCPTQALQQTPSLNETDAGRRILALPATERARMAVAACHGHRWRWKPHAATPKAQAP